MRQGGANRTTRTGKAGDTTGTEREEQQGDKRADKTGPRGRTEGTGTGGKREGRARTERERTKNGRDEEEPRNREQRDKNRETRGGRQSDSRTELTQLTVVCTGAQIGLRSTGSTAQNKKL